VMTTAESSSSSTISNITPTLAPGQSVTTMSFTFSSMSIDDFSASVFISVLAAHLHLDQSKLVVPLITQSTSFDPAQPTSVNTLMVSVSIETPPSSVDAFVNQLSSVTTSAEFRGLLNAAIPACVNAGVTSSQPTVLSSTSQTSTGSSSSSSSTPSIIIAVVVCATIIIVVALVAIGRSRRRTTNHTVAAPAPARAPNTMVNSTYVAIDVNEYAAPVYEEPPTQRPQMALYSELPDQSLYAELPVSSDA
jgi:hypothetical protein